MKTRIFTCLFGLAVGFWPACAATPKKMPSQADSSTQATIGRPRFQMETTEKFSLDSIPTYTQSHDKVYAYIDEHLPEHIEHLQRWVRQRSISPENDGIEEMARLVRDDLAAIGFGESELVETDGYPGVWGYYDAGAERTLVVYMMYDVQPVDLEKWQTDPFAGNLVEHELGTVLMARGAMNQKGPERAFLNAVAAILAVHGTLPVNIIVTADGEEEMGSVHYPQIVSRYEDRLRKAHGVYFPMNSQMADGRLTVPLGVKGIVYYELEAKGGAWGGPQHNGIHGSYKTIVDSPVWRLIKALSCLTAADGNTVIVPGFYDGIRPPTIEEQQLINALVAEWDDSQYKAELGVSRWIDGLTGQGLILEYLYGATLNIDGIWGGYTGPGTKTLLPHQATAKVDSRLPPGLQPERAVALVREYLDRRGFADIELRRLHSGYPSAQTSVSDPWVRAALGVLKKYKHPMSIEPRLAGSAPFYIFTERLSLPFFFSALGHGGHVHAPNEYMLLTPKPGVDVAGLAEIEKSYVDLIYAFATVQ